MELRLYRVILPVNSIDKAVLFYSNIFDQKGMRVSPGRHYFDLNGTIMACYDPIADGDDFDEGWKHHKNQYIYIAVSDLQGVFDKLTNSECQYVGDIKTMPWGETMLYANDPFGNPICFVDEKTIFIGK